MTPAYAQFLVDTDGIEPFSIEWFRILADYATRLIDYDSLDTDLQNLIDGMVDGTGTANAITYWVDADTLGALSTVTYPSLTELSYVKGVTSSLQTQLNGKEPSITAGTTGQYWRGDKSWQTLDKSAVGLGNVDNTSDLNKPISTATQTALDGKVDENSPITGATKTKITYDAKGLVTAGADATTADIADSSNKRYVTDADLTKLSNLSGTNTGDQTITLTGDVTGSGTGSFAATIANDAVTYAKIQNVSATDRLLGRSSVGAGDIEEITCTSFGRSLIDDVDASAARTTLELGTLATQSGTFSGTSSGTNTGDQTITLSGAVTGSGTGAITTTLSSNIDATKIADGTVDNTEFQYLNGVTSSIQTQINGKFTLPSLTSGSVLFSDGTTISQDNANLFWDNSNDRLGIGTITPGSSLHVKNTTRLEGFSAIGEALHSSWSGVLTGLLQIGQLSLYDYSPGTQAAILSNAYFDGSGRKYLRTGSAVALEFQSTGFHILTYDSGTAGNAVSTSSDFAFTSSTGRFGVGTTSPSAKVHAVSTTEQLRLGYDTSNYASFTVDSAGALTLGYTTSGIIPNLSITSNYGINVRNANGVSVRQSANTDGVLIQGTATGTAGRAVTITPATLTANRTLTLPDATGTLFILPTLTSGSILFSDGTTIAQDNSNLFWDNTNDRVGISTTTPLTKLHIADSSTSVQRGILVHQHGANTSGSSILFRKGRGTAASPTVIINGDFMGGLRMGAYSGTSWLDAIARVDAVANGTITSTSIPTDLTFYTGTTTGGAERMRIFSDGNSSIGNTTNEARLSVYRLSSESSVTRRGIRSFSQLDGNNTVNYGLQAIAATGAGFGFNQTIYGVYAEADDNSSTGGGATGTSYALFATVSGTVSTKYAIWAEGGANYFTNTTEQMRIRYDSNNYVTFNVGSSGTATIDGAGTNKGFAFASGFKLGFFGATAIAQPTTAHAAATFTANTGTAVNDASTFDGYTIKQIVKALRDLGILA